MPELPEVETNVKALRPHLVGRKIKKVEIFATKLRQALNIEDLNLLVGKAVIGIRRRAKYIIIDFDGPFSLLVHLGMTGSFRVTDNDGGRQKHEHISFHLDNQKILYYNDPRKFGLISVWDKSEGSFPASLKSLGPEPLTEVFNGRYLKEKADSRKIAVKSFIMDQKIVVGVGNIYANEALFNAGILPQRAAGRIHLNRYEKLALEIKKVLQEAIDFGGSTIINYRNVDGNEGRFSLRLNVYGKEGETCPSCKRTKIRRKVIGGRSTFFCPSCQR